MHTYGATSVDFLKMKWKQSALKVTVLSLNWQVGIHSAVFIPVDFYNAEKTDLRFICPK